MGFQGHGGLFLTTTGTASQLGGGFGLAGRFGYQFSPSWGLHWEPAASLGIQPDVNAVAVWNHALVQWHFTRSVFAAVGPGVAAVWAFRQFGSASPSLNFGAVARFGLEIPLHSRGRSALSIAAETRFAVLTNGTVHFPALALGYEVY
jgi:hypothetical protein